ncbi:MAG: acyl-CoA dehydrogenase [Actinomycetota bacterium]|nr:acyl-CoA dehydrogenase [Actinomycetota bacterium]MDH5278117.1 acyl-CoA dehydrogenase [Actinomycetota bacterium]
MGHYKANLRDITFNLFEVFGRQEVLGAAPYPDMDEDTARTILAEVADMAEGVLAESFADGDRTPPVYDPETRSVTMPESFKKSYRAYVDAGWTQLHLPPEMGGTATPPSMRWSIAEMVLGANPGVHLYTSGAAFSHVFWALGTDEQKKWATTCAERGWGATMVLTEPDAGSDVGAGRTKAVKQEDGSWHLTGVKRFITSAEHDLSDNIFHLVLARPEGAGPGTKGLSLFFVPKYFVDWETGELGARNGVYATNVEHKMGIKVSTTCELTFGEDEPAVGWLVGEVHDGIAQMFRVIEFARMMVGTKAISTLSTGYLNALEYSKSRVQGADLTQMLDKTAPRVTIVHHPDVRRSLLTQKAYAEGLRALMLYAASVQDTVEVKEAAGQDATAEDALNDLLLPIVKGYGSEKSYALLGSESLQCFGGSGYLQDYPLEQYVRDAKIDTLYEGTTAIQGLDLFFRKIVRNNFQAVAALGEQIAELAKGGGTDDALGAERALLGTALEDVQGMLGTLAGFAMASQENAAELYKVGQNTTRLLFAMGDLVVGWLLLRQAEVALAALAGDPGKDKDFYEGKVAAARWFAQQVLPQLSSQRAIAEATSTDLMTLPESAF